MQLRLIMKKYLLAATALVVGMFSLALRTPQEDELAKSIARGKELYFELCITCHLGNGKGTPGAFPPLAQSDFLKQYPEKAIHAIKFGQQGELVVNGVTYNNVMPAQGISDQEIADVMNYIQNSWGNKGSFISSKDVEKIKE